MFELDLDEYKDIFFDWDEKNDELNCDIHKNLLLDWDEFKGRKDLIKKLVALYGNEHVFKNAILKLLTKDKRAVTAFGLYFGYHKETMTYRAIGEQMNISVERVRQLAARGFRKLITPIFLKEVWEDYGYKDLPDPFLLAKQLKDKIATQFSQII
jgi:DNA-directed RNA polymerase specialized sigma subunit